MLRAQTVKYVLTVNVEIRDWSTGTQVIQWKMSETADFLETSL